MNRSYSVDGVPLDDAQHRWFLEGATLLPASAGRRVSSLELPQRDGVVVERRRWGQGSLSLSLVVPGQGTFGKLPSTPVDVRLRELQSLLSRARSVSAHAPGLGVLSCEITQVAVSEPARLSVGGDGSDSWSVTAALTLQPFWSGAETITSAEHEVPSTVPLTKWEASTGDLADAILRIRGPLTRCSIVGVDDTGVSFEGDVPGPQFAFVDVAKFRAWRGGSGAWTPTTTSLLLDYPPAGPLIVEPTTPLKVATEAATAGASMTIRAHQWWL